MSLKLTTNRIPQGRKLEGSNKNIICYRGKLENVSCKNAKTEKWYFTENLKNVTCKDCLFNYKKSKIKVLKDHGTYDLYISGCRCDKCRRFWSNRIEIKKIKKDLSLEYEVSEKEIVDFLNSKISEDSETCHIDLWLFDQKKFRAAALKLYSKN